MLMTLAATLSSWQRAPMSIFDRFSAFYARPLHVAAVAGNLGAVEMLLDFGAEPHDPEPILGRTPLHFAALKGHESCVDPAPATHTAWT